MVIEVKVFGGNFEMLTMGVCSKIIVAHAEKALE
jgi:hypothetical protein